MTNIFKTQLFFILALFPVSSVLAEEASVTSNQEKYINVIIEIHGLEDSAKLFKTASLNLAKKLNQINPDPEEMTPEQLQALTSVIQEANRLIHSIDKSIEQTGPAIENLGNPINKLISDALTVVNQSTIEPAIQSVDDSMTKWLIIIYAGLFLMLLVTGYYFYGSSPNGVGRLTYTL